MEVQNAQKAAQRQSSPMESCSLATLLFVFCVWRIEVTVMYLGCQETRWRGGRES